MRNSFTSQKHQMLSGYEFYDIIDVFSSHNWHPTEMSETFR